ncbi:MAG: heavy-metal-associated domain-containing protein [Thermaurantiacus sp.]
MFKACLAAAALALLPASVALAATPPAATAQAVTVKVNGLVCDFCARSIEAMLKRRNDVSSVHVDLGKGEVHVRLKAGSTLGDAELRKLVRDSGYAVAGIERVPQ